jgi:hypothetical protein
VLDTITGGTKTTRGCEEESPCKEYQAKYKELREILNDPQKKSAYLRENETTEEKLFREKEDYKRIYLAQDKIVKAGHSTEKWDKGSIGEDQLNWIKNELETTDKENVILLSDHPLFKFQGERKEYNIENLNRLTLILKNSSKKIISIAGEAHTWQEKNIDGIQYYIIDQLQTANGSWAILEWDKDGPKMNNITH